MNLQSKSKGSKAWVRVIITALVVLAVTACGAPTSEPVQPTQAVAPTEVPTKETPTEAPPEFVVATLRAAIVGDESTINPYTYVTGFPGWNLLTMQYDTLFTMDVNGEPQPWLVSDYQVSEDNLTYTLDLREDVKWHDGTDFTAEDVKFTFEYFTENTHGRFSKDIGGFESAEVTGDYQVVITLSAVKPTYIVTAFADVPVLPKHIWEDIADPAERDWEIDANVGTGPYNMVEYVPDQFYRFEANADYFAGKPTVGELVVVRLADTAGALSAFRTNEVDIVFPTVPPEQIELLGAVEGVKIAQGPQFSTQMVNFDTQLPPFDQLAVRKAIALALDRDDMVETVYLGAATPGSIGWIHPGQTVFNDSVITEYNPDEAKRLLDEAGIVDTDGDGVREFDGAPMSFELVTPSANALRLRLAELAKQMLLEVGIEVEVASVEQTTWEDAVWPEFDVAKGRNYEMAMWGWSAPTLASPSKVTWLIHSDPASGFLNLTGFANEEADRLSDALNASADPEERAQLIEDIQVVIADEIPFVMLMYPDGIYAYWATVYDNYAFIAGDGIVNKLSFLPEAARP